MLQCELYIITTALIKIQLFCIYHALSTGGITLPRNVSDYSTDDIMYHHRRPESLEFLIFIAGKTRVEEVFEIGKANIL